MCYNPEFGDTIFAYAKKYLLKNAWRTSPMYELDDLLQEAFLLFAKLVDRYKFETPEHFMAMWKRTLHNLVINIARERTRKPYVSLGCSQESSAKYSNDFCEHGGHFDPEDKKSTDALVAIDLKMQIADAPEKVRQLINRSKEKAFYRRRKKSGERGTTGAFLCRRAGIEYDRGFREQFENWLHGEFVGQN
jgi:DNA-directed RNA polymerase specialized sigma24 family protein